MQTPYIISILVIAIFMVMGIGCMILLTIGFFRLSKTIEKLCVKIEVQGEKHINLSDLYKALSIDIANLWEDNGRIWVKINDLKLLFSLHDNESVNKEIFQARLESIKNKNS